MCACQPGDLAYQRYCQETSKITWIRNHVRNENSLQLGSFVLRSPGCLIPRSGGIGPITSLLSGQLAWQPDLLGSGSIDFLGRCAGHDTMTKLQGLPIDLREVAGAISDAAPNELADSAVTVRGEPQSLVCHVVFKPGRLLDQEQLVTPVQDLELPQHITSSAIVPLKRWPVTPNGKLNTTAP